MSTDTPKSIIVELKTASTKVEPNNLSIWLSDNFAEDWYRDALYESQKDKDYHSLRREIIFSVCFAESYIFEWARGILQLDELSAYFPPEPRFKDDPRYRRKLKNKWKEIPKELYEEGKINADPELDLSGLGTLLRYRHGLIHAAASRPKTKSKKEASKPFPTKEDLKKLKSGWAMQIVVHLVENLHEAIGTPLPEYILEA
ncbi:MAG: hypothetical protein ACFFER_13125 [Candidatus Thorarchaeota archaeon]